MTGKRKSHASRDHEVARVKSIRKEPKFAAEYLNTVLEDGDQEEVMIAPGRTANAYGGVPTLAEKAKLNATTLYRTLSRKNNPELRSMSALLKAMGQRLAVQSIRVSAREQRSRRS